MFNNQGSAEPQGYAESQGFSRTILWFREKSWKFLNDRENFQMSLKMLREIFLGNWQYWNNDSVLQSASLCPDL